MSLPQENTLSLDKILTLLTDLLASVSPEEFGEALTRTLRELTGARSVLLVSHQEDWESGSRVYAVPVASAELFSEEELRLLCPLRYAVAPPRKVMDLPADHPLRTALAHAGVTSLHQSLLNAAGEHIGSLLLLDPPQTAATEDLLVQLDRLMPLCSLALRNLRSRSITVEEYLNRFEAIFTHATVPLCYLSRDGLSWQGNKHFFDTFGYTHEDVPTLAEWWPLAYPDPDYRARVMADWDEAVARLLEGGGELIPQEYQITCKDGRMRTVQISGSLLENYLLVTFFDVTERCATEKSLRRSEERFRQVTELTREWIWEVDVDGLYTYASSAVEAILGYRAEEVVGHKYFYDFFLPDEREALKNDAFEVILNGESFTEYENRNLHRNGREVWLSTSGAPFFDETGLLLGYRGSDIDITERKMLDVERERLLQAIEQAGETIVITDAAGIVEYVNPAFEKITGYSRSEVLGKDIEIVKSGVQDEAFYRDLWQTISSGKIWRGHFVNRRKDGSHYDEEATIAPVRDATGKIVNYVATKLDVTERRKVDADLRQKNSEMERFVYTVSHDLKSPLVTIKGFLGVLEEDLAKGDAEAVASDMAFIGDAASHMARLLEELLDLSRIGRVVNPPTAFGFKELAYETLTLVVGAINAVQVEVVISDADVTLYADRRRILEVLQNLVENAIKYRGHQAAPRIAISAEKRPEGWVFCVRDNGLGVAPKYREKIFGLFEKLDASSEGTGVGLALVSRIIELYEGRIWVESEGPGQGSCFCFTLPKAMQPGQVS